MGKNKFYYDVNILENKSVLPERIEALAKKLEDFPLKGFQITAISGTVEKAGEAYTFTARGSKQKYDLKASDELKKLVAAGKSAVTLAGPVTQEKGKTPIFEVTDAKETAK